MTVPTTTAQTTNTATAAPAAIERTLRSKSARRLRHPVVSRRPRAGGAGRGGAVMRRSAEAMTAVALGVRPRWARRSMARTMPSVLPIRSISEARARSVVETTASTVVPTAAATREGSRSSTSTRKRRLRTVGDRRSSSATSVKIASTPSPVAWSWARARRSRPSR